MQKKLLKDLTYLGEIILLNEDIKVFLKKHDENEYDKLLADYGEDFLRTKAEIEISACWMEDAIHSIIERNPQYKNTEIATEAEYLLMRLSRLSAYFVS